MGNSLKRLYSALEEEGMKFKWKNVTISGDKESLVFGFLPQRCPNGTRRHENGFLCGKCMCHVTPKLYIKKFILKIHFLNRSD